MRNYGFHNNNINGLRNAGLTRVTATLLSVRNLIEIDKTQAVPALFEQEYKDDVITSWANPDALSVGFMTDPAVIDYAPDYDNELNVFKKTNEWITSMGAGNVYKPVTLVTGDSTGLTTTDRSAEVVVYGSASSAPKDEYSFRITVEEADIGSDVYVYANAKKGGNVTVTVGDTVRKFEIRSYQIICLGVYDGTPMELYVKYQEAPGSSLFVYGYQLDQEGYAGMLDKLADEQLSVTNYDSTSISGHIDVNEEGLLFLTIPYAEGWTAEVDGKAAAIVPVQDALMGLRLDKGSHDITLRYTPAGFREGLMISAVSVFLIVLLIAVPAAVNHIGKNKKITDASKTPETEDNALPSEVIEEVPVSEVTDEQS